jgi:hypothetical protein
VELKSIHHNNIKVTGGVLALRAPIAEKPSSPPGADSELPGITRLSQPKETTHCMHAETLRALVQCF